MSIDINDVKRMYKAGLISLPDNPQLKNGFDDIMGKLQAILSPKLDEQVIGHLRRMIKMKYTRGIHVAGYQPNVPTTAQGLFDFIATKSTPCETLLLQPAANILCDKDLTEGVQNYESQQDTFFRETVTSCQKRTVKLQHRQDYTHMAVIVSKEQILLSTVVEMKEFFSDFLQLENTLFEGFQERKGCTVFFFSITRVAAAQLFDRVEPYMSDLKTKFGMTDLVAFEYCVCDLERSARGKCLYVSVHMHLCVFIVVHQPYPFSVQHELTQFWIKIITFVSILFSFTYFQTLTYLHFFENGTLS